MRRGTVVALVLAATLLAVSDTWAYDSPRTRKTLAGVPSVYVLVEDLSERLVQAGLSRETLKTDVELRLRAVGIRVATAEESNSLPGAPYVYVWVTGIRNETVSGQAIGYSAQVELEFTQLVRLDREPATHVRAPTWSCGGIVSGGAVEVIRQALRDHTDTFANAYLAANPKT